MKKVAIIFIGTGRYLNFFPDYYENAENYLFPDALNNYYVFTDGDFDGVLPDNVSAIPLEHMEWPYITLYRFKFILNAWDLLKHNDYLLFMDADTRVVEEIKLEDMFDKKKPLTGVHHPCHDLGMDPHKEFPGAFETNPGSTCHIKAGEDISTYWQACVWGGRMKQVKEMMEVLDDRITVDEGNGIIAKWHDESQLNRYFLDNKERVNTLTPSYAYPEVFKSVMEHPPKIVHLAKENLEYQV